MEINGKTPHKYQLKCDVTWDAFKINHLQLTFMTITDVQFIEPLWLIYLSPGEPSLTLSSICGQ